ncbi:MAG: ATP synthase F1 subunit epsilon [Alphaproteobacteria bacterium]|nr:ATP synthase F1 subunit epsilon [Rhodobiaceae bacterium]|tara:strand:- start:6472 stop:6858 length:387 start_codon:yes stop_codon:yes gene_type:complete
MNNKINFDFVSPEASIVSSEVEMVLIPGIDGDAGILPNHSPFMTTLRQGIVEVTFEEGNVKKYLVEGGFADITQDKMTILAENSLNLSDSDSNTLKNEIDIINEKLVSALDNEKILLDERKSLIEDFI